MPYPRKWVKMWCYESLHGSISYQLNDAEQSCWFKLILLAGLCGQDGIIADHSKTPYPHEFVAHEIHSDLGLLESTLDKCKKEGRISENGSGIVITNWTKYQSEYDRQKVYRKNKIAKNDDKYGGIANK